MEKLNGFVVFEGIDGAEKSTLIESVSQALTMKKIKNFVTCSPYLNPERWKPRMLSPMAEAGWYEIDRIEHYHKVIAPKCRANYVVLCDRWYWSTMVYQGLAISRDHLTVNDEARREGEAMGDLFETIREWAGVLEPQIVFWLNTPPQVALDQIMIRSDGELEPQQSFQSCRDLAVLAERYKQMKNIYEEDYWVPLDSTFGTSLLTAQVIKALDRLW